MPARELLGCSQSRPPDSRSEPRCLAGRATGPTPISCRALNSRRHSGRLRRILPRSSAALPLPLHPAGHTIEPVYAPLGHMHTRAGFAGEIPVESSRLCFRAADEVRHGENPIRFLSILPSMGLPQYYGRSTKSGMIAPQARVTPVWFFCGQSAVRSDSQSVSRYAVPSSATSRATW
jgi:hypothetical protein